MTPTLAIEQALQAHEKKHKLEVGQNFFSKYTVLRDRVLTVEYTQTMAGFPEGNDHGPQHIVRVMEYLDALVKGQSAKVLRPYELFLAMMAVLYHDVGILLGRKDHGVTSEFLLSLERNDYVFDETDRELIGVAVRSHSSSQSIEEVCARYREEETVRGHKVRIRMVAALVRLADELDEDQRRAPSDLEAKRNLTPDAVPPELANAIHPLPGTSQFFWWFNQRVRGVSPEPKRKEVDFILKFKPEDVGREVTLPGKKPQLFIHAVLEKILKINRERVECNRFLPVPLQYTQIGLVVHPFDRHPTWRHRWEPKLGDGTTLDELLAKLPAELQPSGGGAGGGGPSGPSGPPAGPIAKTEPTSDVRSSNVRARTESTSTPSVLFPSATSRGGDPPPAAMTPTVIPSNLAVRRAEHELVGRDALLVDVRRGLDDDTWRGVVLHGMPGVGKTSVAETVASVALARSAYPGGVFEVVGATETLFLTGLASVAEALSAPGGMSDDERAGFARRALTKASQRTLLMLDDLDPAAPWVERELRPLPLCVRVLATSTSTQSGFLSGRGRAQWIKVPELSGEAVVELVRSLAPERTDAEITALNTFFDGHTLGLEVAARTLAREPGLTVEAYLREIRDAREVRSGAEIGADRTAFEALGVLWGRLSPNAQNTLAVCGAFGAAPVPVGWLELALQARGMDEAGARGGISEVVLRNLASRVVAADGNLLRIHSIVCAFAHARSQGEDCWAMATGLAGWFEGTWDSEVGLTWKTRWTLPRVELAQQNGGDDPRVLRRLAVVLRLNRRRSDLDAAVTMLRAWLSQRETHEARDEAAEWVQHELARSLILIGTRETLGEAERLLRDLLRLREGKSSVTPSALVVTLNDLGVVLGDLGGQEATLEAESLARRALQIEETVLGAEAPGLATTLSNLAKSLRSLGGQARLLEAERLARRALQIEETALGAEAPSVADRLSILAGSLLDLGGQARLLEAERLARRALQLAETALGAEAPSVARMLANLAATLLDLGGQARLLEAEGHLRRALQIQETALGAEGTGVAVVLTNLAGMLRDLGGRERLLEAEGHARRAAQIDRQTFPGGSPRTSGCLHQIA